MSQRPVQAFVVLPQVAKEPVRVDDGVVLEVSRRKEVVVGLLYLYALGLGVFDGFSVVVKAGYRKALSDKVSFHSCVPAPYGYQGSLVSQ
nr:hypothetical protein [Mycobacteroides abscessus]